MLTELGVTIGEKNLIVLGPNDRHESLTYITALQKHICNLEAKIDRLNLTNQRPI